MKHLVKKKWSSNCFLPCSVFYILFNEFIILFIYYRLVVMVAMMIFCYSRVPPMIGGTWCGAQPERLPEQQSLALTVIYIALIAVAGFGMHLDLMSWNSFQLTCSLSCYVMASILIFDVFRQRAPVYSILFVYCLYRIKWCVSFIFVTRVILKLIPTEMFSDAQCNGF